MSEPPWPDNQYRLRPPDSPHSGGQDAYALPPSGHRDAGRQDQRPGTGSSAGGSWPWEPEDPAPAGSNGGRTSRHQRHSPSPGVRLRPWGTMRGRAGVILVIGGAALGALVTVVTKSQPGLVLGILVVIGTVVAALAVQPRAAHVIIPVPALAYVAAAVLAGMISDRAVNSSATALAVNAAQWVASGFIAMTLATGLAIIIAVGRRVRLSLTGNGQRQAMGGGSRERGPGAAPAEPSRPRR